MCSFCSIQWFFPEFFDILLFNINKISNWFNFNAPNSITNPALFTQIRLFLFQTNWLSIVENALALYPFTWDKHNLLRDVFCLTYCTLLSLWMNVFVSGIDTKRLVFSVLISTRWHCMYSEYRIAYTHGIHLMSSANVIFGLKSALIFLFLTKRYMLLILY